MYISGDLDYNVLLKIIDLNANTNLINDSNKLPKDLQLTTRARYNLKQNSVVLKNFTIETASLSSKITANGKFAKDEIAGEVSYDSKVLEKLLAKQIPEIASNSSGIIKLSGNLEKIIVNYVGDLSFKSSYDHLYNFPDLKITSDFIIANQVITGKLNMQQGLIKANGGFSWQNGLFNLQNFTANAPGFSKKANLSFNPETKIITGKVDFTSKDSEALTEFLPFILKGDMQLQVNYTTNQKQQQKVTVTGNVKRLASKYVSFGNMDINLNINDLWQYKIAKSEINIQKLEYDGMRLKKIQLTAKPAGRGVNLLFNFTKHAPYSMDLEIDSFINPYLGDNITAKIKKISGTLNGLEVKNSVPITLNADNGYIVQTGDINIGSGQVNLESSFKNNNINSTVIFTKLPRKILPLLLPASLKQLSLSGKIELNGNLRSPHLYSNIAIENLLVDKIFKNVNGTIITDITKDNLKLDINIVNKNDKLLQIFTNIPIRFSLSPFTFSISKNRGINANLEIPQSFNLLNIIPVPASHRIHGSLQGSMALTGTINLPNFNGKLTLNNGFYEYERYGLKLKNITADIIGKGRKINLPKVILQDIFKNELTANGQLTLGHNLSLVMDLSSNKFQPINNPYLHGVINTNIQITANNKSAKITGDIKLGPLEIKIPDNFQRKIPSVNVVKVINRQDKEKNKKAAIIYPILLDIKAEADKKVYIRGRGVDSLLKGKLTITGDVSDPNILGELKSVRGTFQEFGKLLKVATGIITFNGKITPSPYLNIRSIYKYDSETSIILTLSGFILDLDIDISSDPEMAEDEALSILLFGEKTDNISSFQAVQLAGSLARLSGKGGGFDPFGTSRKILGVDEIKFKNDPEKDNQTSVGVGKHLTNKVYFEIEQGVQGEAGAKATIEVELTPKISIEAINEEDDNSIGINWRFDY